MSEITDTDRILIEKHLDHALSPEEQTTFNQRLEDPNFAAEVRLYAQSVKAVFAFGDDNLKAMLMEEEAKLREQAPPPDRLGTGQYKRGKPTKTVSLVSRWAMAATVLLLVSLGIWYFNEPKGIEKPPADMVFEQNFVPYKSFENPTVRDNTTKSDREKAYAFYNNGDYKEALVLFEKRIGPPQYKDQFLMANAYLATHQAEKAITLLKQLSINPAFEQQKQAEWFLALSLLKTNPDEAKQLFEKIKTDTTHPFQQKAIQILVLQGDGMK